jgi:alpha-acetolactate decarboxylase
MPTDTASCWDLAVALASHHHASPATPAPVHSSEIFQVSTIGALVAGIYDGDTPYSEITKHGDFGVGTFNALDGEMAAVDGDFFHLHADGSVSPVDPTDLTPFAAVTFFRADAEIDIEVPHSESEVLAIVDAALPSQNLFYAIRIEGRFSQITTRTPVRQSKPYPRLVETTKTQIQHTLRDVSGTVVGFRAPTYAQGMTVAGYHLHFIDESRTAGGHVLDFALTAGTVTLDRDADLHVEMPTSADFLQTALGGTDAAEIEQSESSH